MQFIAEITSISVKPPKEEGTPPSVRISLKTNYSEVDVIELAYLSRSALVFEVRAVQEKLPWDTEDAGPGEGE